MNKRKPLQVYLTEEERSELEQIQKGFGVKTLSNAIRKMIKLLKNLNI